MIEPWVIPSPISKWGCFFLKNIFRTLSIYSNSFKFYINIWWQQWNRCRIYKVTLKHWLKSEAKHFKISKIIDKCGIYKNNNLQIYLNKCEKSLLIYAGKIVATS